MVLLLRGQTAMQVLLARHREALEALTDALLKAETLDGNAIDTILDDHVPAPAEEVRPWARPPLPQFS